MPPRCTGQNQKGKFNFCCLHAFVLGDFCGRMYCRHSAIDHNNGVIKKYSKFDYRTKEASRWRKLKQDICTVHQNTSGNPNFLDLNLTSNYDDDVNAYEKAAMPSTTCQQSSRNVGVAQESKHTNLTTLSGCIIRNWVYVTILDMILHIFPAFRPMKIHKLTLPGI